MEEVKKDLGAAKSKFVVLGVSRRDLLLILSTDDEGEAQQVAQDGVLESKFSDTFVLPVSMHYNEQRVNWKNPDGLKHAPAQGAQLNPHAETGEVEAKAEEKKADEPEVSKSDVSEARAAEQIADGTSVDTGGPDKRLHERSGGDPNKTSAFDGKPQATQGAVSSSQVKGDAKK